jgi:hypothetical protein
MTNGIPTITEALERAGYVTTEKAAQLTGHTSGGRFRGKLIDSFEHYNGRYVCVESGRMGTDEGRSVMYWHQADLGRYVTKRTRGKVKDGEL